MDWNIGNPAEALKNYYEEYPRFLQAKGLSESRQAELAAKTTELAQQKRKLQKGQETLEQMGSYTPADVQTQTTEVQNRAEEKIRQAQQAYDAHKETLERDRDQQIADNDACLAQRLKQLLGENENADRPLQNAEKKALEFEMKRRQFMAESAQKINGYQDSQTQEKLDCKKQVGEWKKKQQEIKDQYAPRMDEYRQTITRIREKYSQDITKAQNAVQEKVSARDEELEQQQEEKKRLEWLRNDEVKRYQREYKESEKTFTEQIRKARAQNRATARLEDSKTSRLNTIKDRIEKADISAQRKLAAVDSRMEQIRARYAKQISKAEDALHQITEKQNAELRQPLEAYNAIKKEQENLVGGLQRQIDEREQRCEKRLGDLKTAVETQQAAQVQYEAALDQQIIDFVMNGDDNCYVDVQDETYAGFVALQGKIDRWGQELTDIAGAAAQSLYPKVREKEKRRLSEKSYAELQKELNAAQADTPVSLMARYHTTLLVLGGVVAALGLGWFLALYCALGQDIGLRGLLAAVLGLALVGVTLGVVWREFAARCRYISLAADYREFHGLASHMAQETQKRELARMREMGSKLYDTQYGKREAQKIHDEKDADIRADFQRNLQLMTVELDNHIAEINREKESAIRSLRQDADEGQLTFNRNRELAQNDIKEASRRMQSLQNAIEKLNAEQAEAETYFRDFENSYQELMANLERNDKWMPSMAQTQGKLAEEFYIAPEKAAPDEYGHKKIYRVQHGRKAQVITYDVSGIDTAGASQVEAVGKIIYDLMLDLLYAVYHMNNKEIYMQYVVDGVGGTNELKKTSIKNAFNIRSVVTSVEEIKGQLKMFAEQRERFAESGQQIDEVNERKFRSQDRPEIYTILYIIYRPNEKRAHLEEEVKRLIPECDKYGFFPVFICEAQSWAAGLEERESCYKEIRDLTSNPILVFDGKTYTENP